MRVVSESPIDDRPTLHRLLEALALRRRTAVLAIHEAHGRHGAIYLRDGRIVDAELGPLHGEDAVLEILSRPDEAICVELKHERPTRANTISRPLHDLVLDGLGRAERWATCVALLPALDSVRVVDLARVAHEHQPYVRLLDGRRTLLDVVEQAGHELETMEALVHLERDGVLVPDDELDPVQAAAEAERWLARTGARLHAVRQRWIAGMALLVFCASVTVTMVARRHASAHVAHVAHRVQARVAPVTHAAPPPPPLASQTLPDPDPAALVRESEALLERGAGKRALALAQRAVELAPATAEAYVVIGTVEQQRGAESSARRAYARYLALAPDGAYASDLRAVLRSMR